MRKNLVRRIGTFALCASAAALFQFATAPRAFAEPILGVNLSTFAILGGAGVTIDGTGSVITGSIGAYPTTSITGVIPTNFTISGGTVQSGGATAQAAQDELSASINFLNGLGSNGTVSSLGGLTLAPGVYSSASTMDLTGTLILDGGGNANALWVFQVGSALNTASSSVINVINSGAGAGVFWVLPTGSGTAVLGSNSTFAGNILANVAINVNTNVTNTCGRYLTQTASVTLAGTDTIGTGCSSYGLSGSGLVLGSDHATVVDTATGGVVATVPEPNTLVLLAVGLTCLVTRRFLFT